MRGSLRRSDSQSLCDRFSRNLLSQFNQLIIARKRHERINLDKIGLGNINLDKIGLGSINLDQTSLGTINQVRTDRRSLPANSLIRIRDRIRINMETNPGMSINRDRTITRGEPI